MAVSAVNRFGWVKPYPDGNDPKYRGMLVAPQVHQALAIEHQRVRPYKDGPLLNQGDTPKCVAFAGRGFIDGAPIMSPPGSDPTTDVLYTVSQENDEFPGTNYDGTSVHGLMKALVLLGVIRNYGWMPTTDEMIHWLLYGLGTLIGGSDWFPQMSQVDGKGFMLEPPRAMATPIGGHAWRVVWYDAKKDAFLMRNSWGHEFGFPDTTGQPSGYAWMRRAFLDWLLPRDTEMAGPTQVRLTPVRR